MQGRMCAGKVWESDEALCMQLYSRLHGLTWLDWWSKGNARHVLRCCACTG